MKKGDIPGTPLKMVVALELPVEEAVIAIASAGLSTLSHISNTSAKTSNVSPTYPSVQLTYKSPPSTVITPSPLGSHSAYCSSPRTPSA